MKRRDEYVEPVVKLMRRTAEGDVSWHPTSHRGTMESRGEQYEATFKDRTFHLYDAAAYLQTYPEDVHELRTSSDPNRFFLEVVGPGNNVLRFPQLQVIDHLAQIVKGSRPQDELEELNRLLDED